jgi:hypothetical protein
MRQCHFDDFIGKIGPFSGPIAKRRPKSMHGQIIASHAPQKREHGHITERLLPTTTGK